MPQPSNNETPLAISDGPPVIDVVPDPPPQPDDEIKDDASNPGDNSDPEHEVDIPVATQQKQHQPPAQPNTGTRTRSGRISRPPQWHADYHM